jgi:hypothetical protein
MFSYISGEQHRAECTNRCQTSSDHSCWWWAGSMALFHADGFAVLQQPAEPCKLLRLRIESPRIRRRPPRLERPIGTASARVLATPDGSPGPQNYGWSPRVRFYHPPMIFGPAIPPPVPICPCAVLSPPLPRASAWCALALFTIWRTAFAECPIVFSSPRDRPSSEVSC